MSDIALKFGAKDDGLTAQFRKVDKELDQFEKSAKGAASEVERAFKALKGLAAAGLVGGAVRELVGFADAVNKLAVQTNLSVLAVQRLQFVASQSDVEFGAVASAVTRLQRVLGGFEEGSETATKALSRLGLANQAFFASSPDQQFEAVAQAVSKLSNQNTKVLATTELFGRAGAELLPVLQAIGTQAGELDRKFQSIGGGVGEKAIGTLNDLGDAASAASDAARNFGANLLAAVAPPIIFGLQKISEIFAGLSILAAGGNDPSVNLTQQVEQLEAQMRTELALAARAGAHADEVRASISARFEKQIAELKRQQDLLLKVGVEGSKLVGKERPASATIMETDAQREERLKAESEQRAQRLEWAATVHQIEEDMYFQHTLKLAEIDQKALDQGIARATENAAARVKVWSAAEEAMEMTRQFFGVRQVKFEKDMTDNLLNTGFALLEGMDLQSKAHAKRAKILAKTIVIIDTAQAVMKAFATYGPTPMGFAAAGLMIAQGALQIARINSANYGGGGDSGVSGSSVPANGPAASTSAPVATTAAATEQSPRGMTTVYINGFITRDVVDMMMDALREGFDRDVLIIPGNSLQAAEIREPTMSVSKTRTGNMRGGTTIRQGSPGS